MANALRIDGAGRFIRQLREEAGFKLNELALSLGWDKGRLSKYENGRLAVSLPVLEEIAVGLGLRPEVVVFRCMKHLYPKLSGSEAGTLLETLIHELGGTDSSPMGGRRGGTRTKGGM